MNPIRLTSSQESFMERVERIAIIAVNQSFSISRPNLPRVERAFLYEGRGHNVMMSCAVARRVAFYFMHEVFGFTHREISARSGMRKKSVIRIVHKTRSLMNVDIIFINAKTIFNELWRQENF